MSLVVDASVALKWVVAEPDSDVAKLLIPLERDLFLPDFLLHEAANVLWVQVRKRKFTPDEARYAFPDLTADITPVATQHLDLHPIALDIAIATNHPVYDTIYIAFALAVGARAVVAADRAFHQAMRRHPDPAIAGMVLPLDEWARSRGIA